MSCFTERKTPLVRFTTDEGFIVEFTQKELNGGYFDHMSVQWFAEDGNDYHLEWLFSKEPMTSKSIDRMFTSMRNVKKDKLEHENSNGNKHTQ